MQTFRKLRSATPLPKGMGCLHTHSWVFSYEKGVVLPGVAHARVHGFPTNLDWSFCGEDPVKVAATSRNLMGASYSIPSAAHAIAPAVLTLGALWWESATTKRASPST